MDSERSAQGHAAAGHAPVGAASAEDWEGVAGGFAAIGAPVRLGIIRLLVRAGGDRLSVGEIGERLAIAPSTLAHHLRALSDGGLIEQTREGRQTLTRARFDRLQVLSDFLLAECCVERRPEIDHG
ncbi:MAG: helix-turn-helix domain-containing protein [Pseudomonadota bacterium]